MPSVPPGELDRALRLAFPSLSEDTYVEAENICNDVALSAQDLFIKWEAFAMRNKRGTEPPTGSDLRALRSEILKENSARKNASSNPVKSEPRMLYPSAAPPPVVSSVNDFFAYAEELLPVATMEDDNDHVPMSVDENTDTDTDNRRARSHKQESKLSPDTKAKIEDRSLPSSRILFGDQGDEDESFIRSAKEFNDPSGIKLPGDDSTDNKFAQRQGVGKVECTFGDEEAVKSSKSKLVSDSLTSVKIHEQYIIGEANRYMNDEMRNKVEAVRTHVRELGSRLIERAKNSLPDGAELPPSPPDVFTTPSSDTVMAIGRIRVELGGTDGSVVGGLNEKSVVLESEDGHWLRLNLNRIKEAQKPVFLHPGMVVALEGVNTNGRVFDVSEIHDNAIPISATEGGQVKKEEDAVKKMDDGNDDVAMDEDEGAKEENTAPFVHMLVAGGPYTAKNNLKYEPLDELAAVIKSSKPDVVLLTGPFLDGAHDLVDEKLPVSFETIFESRVLSRIAKMAADNENTHFVIQPSLNDVHHDYVVPQPPYYRDAKFNLPKHVTFVSNPAVVRLSSNKNEYRDVCVGISSLPALSDISGDCLCWNAPTDRFGAIVGHMIRQTSFYPTNPPSQNVPVDSTLAYEKVSMPPGDNGVGIGIDVLITPNKLKQFIKVAENDTLVVNPGTLTRGIVGGSYSEIYMPYTEKNISTGKKKERREMKSSKCFANVLKL